ncbi:MAG: hypothetical protein CMN31_21935 [Sandaracinus sp.]|nr:hypothetical protein [Myxococcales bacterium]MAT27441.1 hypothetical protein [Sandaracinus sp.]MBJ73952.1 hypothetical protein [Sandaracinus sp.]
MYPLGVATETGPASRAGSVHEGEWEGERLLVLALPEPGSLPELTPSERDIVAGLMRGKRNRELAAERGVSAGTIANQVATLLRKWGVHSRWELVAALTGPTSRP